MVNLIEHGTNPAHILGLTFSQRAALELKQRIASIIGPEGNYIVAKTFHSFGVGVLKADGDTIGLEKDFQILSSPATRTGILNDALSMLSLSGKYKQKMLRHDILQAIDQVKFRLLTPNTIVNREFELNLPIMFNDFRVIYTKYQELLRSRGYLDFSDIIMKTVQVLKKPEIQAKYNRKHKTIFVDEYQDTNYAQYMIMKNLTRLHDNICVVGDLDQRIYTFQGANSKAGEMFLEDFPNAKIIKMEQNYRSTSQILTVANTVIQNNRSRIPTTMFTHNNAGHKPRIFKYETPDEEVDCVLDDIEERVSKGADYNDFAIMYRLNRQSAKFELECKNRGMPFTVNRKTKSFFQLDEVKDVMSFLQIVNDINDTAGFCTNLKLRYGIGPETVNAVLECADRHQVTPYEAVKICINDVREMNFMTRQQNLLPAFIGSIDYLSNYYKQYGLEKYMDEIIKHSGYVKGLQELQNSEYYDNIIALKNEVLEYAHRKRLSNEIPTAGNFLDEVSGVVSDQNEPEVKGIMLSTIHGAKGKEFKHVYIVGMNRGILPYSLASIGSGVEEERRLFYVAITRAMKSLTLSYTEKIFSQFTKDNLADSMPSRFLDEIPEEIADFQ